MCNTKQGYCSTEQGYCCPDTFQYAKDIPFHNLKYSKTRSIIFDHEGHLYKRVISITEHLKT